MLQASVIVPTRGRPDYLRVALESLAAQDLGRDSFEVLVVDDGPDELTRASSQRVAERTGAPIGYVERQGAPGLNSARNTGVAAAASEFVVFVDDDVEAPPGWLRALVDGRARHPEALVFGGPIRLRLEGSRLPMCGREHPPITTLDAGERDREVDVVWGANMAADRRAFELAGHVRRRGPVRVRRGHVGAAAARARRAGRSTSPTPASSTAAIRATRGCGR